MGLPAVGNFSSHSATNKSISAGNRTPRGISRLDLAKMAVESMKKLLDRRIHNHNASIMGQQNEKLIEQNGFTGFASLDQFLLITTGYQHQSDVSAYTLAGRLVVGFEGPPDQVLSARAGREYGTLHTTAISHNHETFERALKHIRVTQGQLGTVQSSTTLPESEIHGNGHDKKPEDNSGVLGINAALSAGLQLMSRYRLHHRWTENFGLGRLPSCNLVTHTALGLYVTGVGSVQPSSPLMQQASAALQPACLILLTDGESFTNSPERGGGTLQLQFGNTPLREFYTEPFRWDQRIFCVQIGTSTNQLDTSLRALCDVTGGAHTALRTVHMMPSVLDSLLKIIAPPLPTVIPLPNPLRSTSISPLSSNASNPVHHFMGGMFVNGGPICRFQQLETGPLNEVRAMLLYVPSELDTNRNSHHPPVWCIPESFFPNKRMDSLPPRTAQPILLYSRNYKVVDTHLFDPEELIRGLCRLDQLTLTIDQLMNNHKGRQQTPISRLIQRDVYICEWLSSEGIKANAPQIDQGQEYFPVFVRGAGRNAINEGDDNLLCIGVLHIPNPCSTLALQAPKPDPSKLSTMILMPPDMHILLPLLLRAAEIEHRTLRKITEKRVNNSTPSYHVSQVLLDDHWKNEMRAYLFRIPPYYLITLKRILRSILPSSVHSLLNTESVEVITAECFSRLCHQKIRTGEQLAKEQCDRADHRHDEIRKNDLDLNENDFNAYGKFDRRFYSTSSYLATLRTLPPPRRHDTANSNNDLLYPLSAVDPSSDFSVAECLRDMPSECLLAYYESRRRWIFGGSGETVKGLSVEGVKADSDTHIYDHHQTKENDSLLLMASVGAKKVNSTTIAKMGDFRERLLCSRQSFIGYGLNGSNGSVIATAADGAPLWSVDDDALPVNCFDPITGEFNDSSAMRIRLKLSINFGNPFKQKRGDSMCPQKFEYMCPKKVAVSESVAGSSSPLIDPFANAIIEGEGEATPILKRKSESQSDSEEKKIRVSTSVSAIVINGQRQHSEGRETSPATTKIKPPPPPPPPIVLSHLEPEARQHLDSANNKPPPPPLPPLIPAAKNVEAKTLEPSALSKDGMQDPENKPKVDLPTDWMLVWSKSQRRWYYFNKRNNSSVWEWPPPIVAP